MFHANPMANPSSRTDSGMPIANAPWAQPELGDATASTSRDRKTAARQRAMSFRKCCFAYPPRVAMNVAPNRSEAVDYVTLWTFAATGALAGLASQSFTSQGVLLADGALAGASVMVMVNAGTLNDSGALPTIPPVTTFEYRISIHPGAPNASPLAAATCCHSRVYRAAWLHLSR